MSIFHKFITCFISIIFCCNLWSSTLDCLFFKVGQANFVLLTKDTNALVVDCGVGSGYGDVVFKNFSTAYAETIKNKLTPITNLKIVVTHNHSDHYGSINNLKSLIEHINRRKIFKITPQEIKYFDYPKKSTIVDFLNGSLGSEVTFDVIAADDFDETMLNPDDIHQKNLVLNVNYQGHSILLPGDAGGNLFSYHCLNTTGFLNLLSKASVLLLPHHGSWENGEQFWLEAFLKNPNNLPKLSIISSDPNFDNSIPRLEYTQKIITKINKESLLHKFLCSKFYDKEDIIEGIEEDMIDSEIGSFKQHKIISIKTRQYKVLETSIQNNLFLTAAAESIYYRVTISDKGELFLYDGEQQLFTTQLS